MIDTLIVVKSNQYGLTRDAKLLAGAIRDAGVPVEIAGISDRSILDRLLKRRSARRIIHLERVFPQWIAAAEENILIPNQERFPRRHLGRLRHIDLILAKTLEACAVFAGHGVPIEHLGFTSEDRFDPTVAKDWNRVLHLAGGSTLKGTEDVLALWDRHPEWPELVLVQKRQNAPRKVADNVRLITGYLDDGSLHRLQNECGIHLCPSRSEGWGHNLVEGLSCGALVITTDGPPMNEHVRPEFGLLVAADRAQPRHMGTNHFVSLEALGAAMDNAISMPWSKKASMGDLARKRFVEIDRDFRRRASEILAAGATGSGERVAT
jgi:glycosyltransferase involved in cell wall biosynthesis